MPFLCPSQHYVPAFPWDLDALPFVVLADHGTLPPMRGIYFIRTAEEVLYIGASGNLHNRMAHHQRLHFLHDVQPPIFIAWLPFPHAYDKKLLALEKQTIAYYRPLLNGLPVHFWKDASPLDNRYMAVSFAAARKALAHLLPQEDNHAHS